MSSEFAEDLALALRLADAADAITLRSFRAADLQVRTKPDATPVTEADTAVERAVRQVLAAERPGDAVLGEEYGTADGGARRWVVDPIDGTKNYLRGVPVWATLVALLADGEPVVGVASAPALGRRWWAAAGAGAWVADPAAPGAPRRLRVSAVADLADASFSHSDAVGWGPSAPGLGDLLAGSWRTRAYGDFWSHLLVAEGAVDAAAEPELHVWDVAALVPIVAEAGGRITAFDGGPVVRGGAGGAGPDPAAQTGAVTTNGLLHGAVLALLAPRR